MTSEALCRCGKPLSMHHDSREPNLPAGAVLSHPGTPTPVPSEVVETTAGEREVSVTELLHAFNRSTGICRCGAGPFVAAEWLAHYRAQDQPVRVTTDEREGR